VVAAGISEALVTTQTGLMIALPGLFLVMYIQRQRHILDANLTRLESLTMSRFAVAEVAADPSESKEIKEKEGRWHDAA
jgi:biopolymer transport protein ExbB